MKKHFVLSCIIWVYLTFAAVVAQAQITEVSAAQYMKHPAPISAQVLDVRADWEYKEGHLPKALNYDFNGDKFKDQISKLDRKANYVLYCHGGGRSSEALKLMRKQGFQNIIHITDGFAGLKRAGVKAE